MCIATMLAFRIRRCTVLLPSVVLASSVAWLTQNARFTTVRWSASFVWWQETARRRLWITHLWCVSRCLWNEGIHIHSRIQACCAFVGAILRFGDFRLRRSARCPQRCDSDGVACHL